ncbi:MAG: hypothetical protein K0R38_5510 [Polyangiaceae bacterium]|jgi:hypothetical protein|nr:hypothetical protein [Polyangiaceae bacterium]
MREFRHFRGRGAGAADPLTGPFAPIALGFCALLSVGCSGKEHEESLPLLQVGMTDAVEAIYDDGELAMYEVKKGIAFPILAPDAVTRGQLNARATAPYGPHPWVTTDDVDVQVNFTISNLDDEEHVVQMLVDPWNEFGRYYPGLQLTNAEDEEYMPNFSGIDKRYIAPGKGAGEASRLHGTYTFTDLQEMATDLATVMSLLADPPATEDEEEDPTVAYTNHAFHSQNRSDDDPLVAQWVPQVVAGLTGLDIGFRTYERANLAIEVAIELVDKNGKRIRREGDEEKPLLEPTEEIITVGVAAP